MADEGRRRRRKIRSITKRAKQVRRLYFSWLSGFESRHSAPSPEIDFIIWAVYGELHTKSIENFKRDIMIVSISELSHTEIRRRHIKARLKADMG